VREQLEAHCLEVVQPYENRINYYLDLFNAGFKIVRTGHGYPGGIATSTYQLSINETHVELGDGRTPADRPSFRNTLSVGDRATFGAVLLPGPPGAASPILPSGLSCSTTRSAAKTPFGVIRPLRNHARGK